MADITNQAKITYSGKDTLSNIVTTLLELSPTVIKTVNLPIAFSGDTLLYTVAITNPNLTTISSVLFSDTIDPDCTYVAGSLKLNGTVVTPTSTSPLTYTVASIATLATATLTFNCTVN